MLRCTRFAAAALFALMAVPAFCGCASRVETAVRLPTTGDFDLALVVMSREDASGVNPVVAHTGFVFVASAQASLSADVGGGTELRVFVFLYRSSDLAAALGVPALSIPDLVQVSFTGTEPLPVPAEGGSWVSMALGRSALSEPVAVSVVAPGSAEMMAVTDAVRQLRLTVFGVADAAADGGADAGSDATTDSGIFLGDYFVDDNAAPGGTGSFAAPFNDPLDALEQCNGSPTVIYFFPGTYTAPASVGATWLSLPANCSLRGAGAGKTTLDGAGAGRVIAVDNGGVPGGFLEGLRITNGSTLAQGAAASLVGGVFSLIDLVLEDNVSGASGGAVNALDMDSLTVTGCAFRNNAANNAGAGLRTVNVANVLVERGIFDGNTTLGTGGGFHTRDSVTTVIDTDFSGNQAGMGGALSVNKTFPVMGTDLTFVGGSLVGNTATTAGGFFMTDGAVVDVRNAVFSGNTATASAGGMLVAGGILALANSFVVGNVAAGSGGGAEVDSGASADFRHVTFADNDATTGMGGGLSCPGMVTVTGTIFWGNTAGAPGRPDFVGCSPMYSLVQAAPTLVTNIVADPLFLDAASGDYHLLCGSPAIGAADPAASPPLFDFEGDLRDSAPDIGADEAVGCP